MQELVNARGVPVNLPGKDALSPLQQVLMSKEPNLKTLKLLVELGSDVNRLLPTSPSPQQLQIYNRGQAFITAKLTPFLLEVDTDFVFPRYMPSFAKNFVHMIVIIVEKAEDEIKLKASY